jgi:hypothetical protein
MQRYTRGLNRIGGRRLRRLVLGGLLVGAVALPSVATLGVGADILPGDPLILGPGSRPICRCAK